MQNAPRARIWRSRAVTRTAKLEVKGRRIIIACKCAVVHHNDFISTHPRHTYRHCQEHQLGPVPLQILLEDEARPETADHVAEESKRPDEVDGVNVHPSVPAKINILMCWSFRNRYLAR